MHLIVDALQRASKQRAHTATHLLHYMLDKLLGGTKQAGSVVDSDLLRFDFATKEPLSQEHIHTIENEINARINHNLEVSLREMSLEEAKKTGAKAFFEDKYGDTVRVIQIPTHEGTTYAGYSTELCGGTHVASTGLIGAFKITGQEAVASGIRRVEAVTGPQVALYAQQKEQEQYGYAALLDCSPKQIEEKIQKLIGTCEEQQHRIDSLQSQIIHHYLLSMPQQSGGPFTYVTDVTKQVAHIPLKTLVQQARDIRGERNRLLYTTQGQFALCADQTKNAKELQQKYGLKGGGDNQLIQGKDETIIKHIQAFSS